VLTVSVAHLMHDTYSSFLAPVLPIIIKTLGISKFQGGMLDFAIKIPSLLNPLFGIIADKIDAKYFMIVGIIIMTVAMSMLGLASDFVTLFILILTGGIGSSIFHVPGPVIIKKVAGDNLGLGMSFYMLGGELARTLGPLMILTAISVWSFEGSWRVMPLGLGIALLLYYRIRKIKVHKKVEKNEAAKANYRKYLPFFAVIAGITVCRAGMHSALTLYLPIYLTSKGFSLWAAGISLSLFQFAGAAGTFTLGMLSDRFGRKKSLLYLSLLNPLFMFAFNYSSGFGMYPILVGAGLVHFGVSPIILAMVQEHDTENLSFLNGTYMTVSFLGSSAMVLTIGYLSDRIGLGLTYDISAYLSILVIPFVLMLKEKK
jgi:MFS transporter, FSR family, fosmidomycin resistance protein